MYYSHSLEDQKLDSFIAFLNHIIEGKQDYKKLVYQAIKDTHELASGAKTYYTVDRSSYPVIIHLFNRANDYFKGINPDNLSNEDYKNIKQYASQQRDLAINQ